MPQFYLVPLKVHCWGGLGSQLLALNYYLNLTKKMSKRKIVLVLHTDGITNRPSEIDFLNSKIFLQKVNDFHENSESNKKSINFMVLKKILFSFKKNVKLFLNFSNIVITDDSKILDVKYWTLSVRSTYILNPLVKPDIVSLSKYLGILQLDKRQNAIGVHFRFGDLAVSKPISLVSTKNISVVINDLFKLNSKINTVTVYSDSASDNKFFEVPDSVQVKWCTLPTLNTIKELLNFEYFIGTSSKVSIWVAIFRWGLDIKGEVLLSKDSQDLFSRLTGFKISENNDFILKTY